MKLEELQTIVKEHSDDKEFLLKLIQEEPETKLKERNAGRVLAYASDRLRKDRELVFACVNVDGRALRFADEGFSEDYEICLLAVERNSIALEFVSKRLRADRDFCLEVYRIKQMQGCLFNLLGYFSEKLRDDDELGRLYAEGKKNYMVMSERLRDKKEIALIACKYDYNTYQYCSERLHDDEDVLMEVVKSKCSQKMIKYASERLRNSKELAYKICAISPHFYQEFSEETKRDTYLVALLAKDYPEILRDVPEEMRDNEKFVHYCVEQNGRLIVYASKRLQRNRRIVFTAIEHGARTSDIDHYWDNEYYVAVKMTKQNPGEFKRFVESFRNDWYFMLLLLNGHIPHRETESYLFDGYEYTGECIVNMYDYLGEQLRTDEAFAKMVCEALLESEYGERADKEKLLTNPLSVYKALYEIGESILTNSYVCLKGLDFTKWMKVYECS